MTKRISPKLTRVVVTMSTNRPSHTEAECSKVRAMRHGWLKKITDAGWLSATSRAHTQAHEKIVENTRLPQNSAIPLSFPTKVLTFWVGSRLRATGWKHSGGSTSSLTPQQREESPQRSHPAREDEH